MKYRAESRAQLLKFFETRAPKYGRPTASRQRAKAEAILRRPVPIERLSEVTRTLGDLVYAVIGGHAVTFHGHPRTTEDIDILVKSEDLQHAVRAMGGVRPTPLTIGGCSIHVGGIAVDLVAPDQPWVEPALAAATSTPHGKVISKPYLILMKLWAMRGEQDDTDVISILRLMRTAERRAARRLVARYQPSMVEDLDSMVRIAEM